jgi:3-isopropylmalate/(R)-2-methylmalate dehydratase small subunit
VRESGRVAILDRPDVDTDQIIPKQFLKRIERTGYGEMLFHDWRYDEDGNERPGFELNRPEFRDARVLLAGRNFGCGSSREHAAWALQDYGFDVVIAPSFGDIFFTNSVQIGLVPVVLPQPQVKALMESARTGLEITVDLENETVGDASGRSFPLEMDPFVRHCLLNGLDSIALTLQSEAEIGAFEARTTQPVSTAAL